MGKQVWYQSKKIVRIFALVNLPKILKTWPVIGMLICIWAKSLQHRAPEVSSFHPAHRIGDVFNMGKVTHCLSLQVLILLDKISLAWDDMVNC